MGYFQTAEPGQPVQGSAWCRSRSAALDPGSSTYGAQLAAILACRSRLLRISRQQ